MKGAESNSWVCLCGVETELSPSIYQIKCPACGQEFHRVTGRADLLLDMTGELSPLLPDVLFDLWKKVAIGPPISFAIEWKQPPSALLEFHLYREYRN